ncbi:MAG: choice-of-anchor D domain-containing protein [Bryobacteraceae bacterium]|nr:choice-of-anchor D domain-containing protein [Bryobacteraceae bacterium]
MDRRNGLQTTLAVLSLAVLAWNAAGQTENARAWGESGSGQLGNGFNPASIHSKVAVPVNNLTGAMRIAAGGRHSLALKNDGTVWAWGANHRGELGTGTNILSSNVPVPVTGLTGVIAVAAGGEHSLALKSDGTVWAWGANRYGQLGNGSHADANMPVRVSNLTGVVEVTAGGAHSLARKGDGTVWAWGSSGEGQLGNGANTDSSLPVAVSSLNGVVAIAAGGAHSLAIKSDRTVWAWGSNSGGQLGNGTYTHSSVPVAVSNLTGAVAIAGGGYHSLGLKDDGTVWAWGSNWSAGQLGTGLNISRGNVPLPVSNLTGVVAIAASDEASLALRNDSTVWGWGRWGGGPATDVPVQATSLSGTVAIAAGYGHNLALKSDGTVWAWGSNTYGELGNGMSQYNHVPVVVSGLTGVVAVAGGAGEEEGHVPFSLALQSDGTVWAWGLGYHGRLGNGANTDSSLPVKVSNLTGAVAIAGGGYHALALRSDGTVWAWGDNSIGQLGNGTTVSSSVPVAVSSLTGVVAIAAGPFRSLALKGDGTVWTWGEFWGTTPVPVSNLHGVVAIAASWQSLALRSDGTVWAWGWWTNNVPARVSDLTDVVAIAAGRQHSLALKSDGRVWAWGRNGEGELGNGGNVSSDVPVPVSNLNGAVAIAAGANYWGPGFSLALKGDGTVWAWGDNEWYQLGNNTVMSSNVPLQVSGLAGAVAIGAGELHSLAALANGIPQVMLDPTSFSFGNQTAGTASAPRVLTVINSGETPLAIHGVTLTGMHPVDFNKVTDGCAGTTVPAGGRCTVSVRFAPTGPGNRSGALLITSNAPGSAHLIPLAGTGVGPPPGAPVLRSPANGATGLPLKGWLGWWGGEGATSHDVHFGTASSPPLLHVTGPATGGMSWVDTLTAGTTYYWQVVAKNGAGSTSSPVWSFTTLAVPGAPALTAPANGATGVSVTPTLAWTAGSGATSYDVYWGTAPSPQNIAPSFRGTSYLLTGLFPETKYYWKVVARNEAGLTSSPVWSFTTPPPPGAPTLLSPTQGATGVSLTPTLNWTGGGAATSHDVYFGKASSPPLVTNTTATSYAPSGLAAGTRYYWKVVAKNGAGSKASAVWSFTTLGAPGNPSPANGATGVPASQALTWTCSGATSYDVFFGLTSPPSQVASTAPASYSPQGLAAGKTYYWKVVARNGAATTTSPIWSFTTQPVPGAPTLLSPADGARGVPLTPTLAWVGGSGATSHDVHLGTSINLSIGGPSFVGNTTSNRYTTGTLNPNTTYYWQCRAKNSYGSTRSAIWSFTTTSAGAPGVATLVSPANGATGVSQTPTLTWKAATGATSYEIFATTSAPAGVKASAAGVNSMTYHSVAASTTGTTVTMRALMAKTKYYWWVVAKNATGQRSSAIQYFTTR